MRIGRIFLVGILLIVAAGCTTSKWTVVDQKAVDDSENPNIVKNSTELILEEPPTVESPLMRLALYNIVQTEYAERVKVQRLVQEYKPKWGFTFLAAAGAAVSFLAANSDYLVPAATTTQRISLNATGGILALLAVTNLKETGDPILTDETRFLRQTGFEMRTDTLTVNDIGNETASVSIFSGDLEILNEPSISLSNGYIEINLGALSSGVAEQIDANSEFVVYAGYQDIQKVYTISVTDFLESFFVIDEPIAQIRSGPSINRDNVIAEVGEESALKIVNVVSEQWVEIEYGNSTGFLQQMSGRIEWRSTSEDGPALLVELEDIPFGEIDVESSIPVLKSGNPSDRALVLSSNKDNQAGPRQFSERDEQLFRQYMRTALQLRTTQINTIDSPDLPSWLPELESCKEMGEGSLYIYLTGYARSYTPEAGPESLALFHVNETGEESILPLPELFERLAGCTSEKMFVFVDLEYVDELEGGQIISFLDANGGKQQRLANRLLREFPNAFLLFGNRIGQSSLVYTGSVDDDKRHHIFPYFWAQAIQQRKTQMSDLVRHLESNVDYTARRLHDRPQEVRGFGNFMLDITR